MDPASSGEDAAGGRNDEAFPAERDLPGCGSEAYQGRVVSPVSGGRSHASIKSHFNENRTDKTGTAAPADECRRGGTCFVRFYLKMEYSRRLISRMPYMRFVISFAASPPSIGRKASTSAMIISSKERATVLNTGFRKGT